MALGYRNPEITIKDSWGMMKKERDLYEKEKNL
jgi:hypothetical protein